MQPTSASLKSADTGHLRHKEANANFSVALERQVVVASGFSLWPVWLQKPTVSLASSLKGTDLLCVWDSTVDPSWLLLTFTSMPPTL